MKLLCNWMRDLHFYLGLFFCPVILIFAVSTVLLNHPKRLAPDRPGSAPLKQTIPIDVPDGTGTVNQARAILRQLGVTGEIDYIRHSAKDARLSIPVSKPGQTIKVEVDLRTKTATVERHDQGLAAALIYLHKMPGPHNVNFRGNWIFTVWWGALADTTVLGIMFLTVSGLYLWWKLKPERVIGWAFLGAGVLTVTVLVAAIWTA